MRKPGTENTWGGDFEKSNLAARKFEEGCESRKANITKKAGGANG